MKLRANRADLSTAASDAARVLAAKLTPNPIMAGVLIDADTDGQVTVTAYDYDTCIVSKLTADVLDAGRALAPGRRLADFLSAMPAGTVELDDSGDRLSIAMPRARYGLGTLHVDDYPGLPPLPPQIGTVDVDGLSRGLGKVAPSARPVEGMWWSGHVALHATPAGLGLFATDRYTIGMTTLDWTSGGPEDILEATVPARTLTDALRNMTGLVEVHIDDTGVALSSANRTVIVRRSSEPYLPVQKVIDQRPAETTRILVDATELSAAMGRAAKGIGRERVPVTLDVDGDGLRYMVTADDSGADGDVDLLGFEGEPVTVGVNPSFMADALKAFGDATISILLGPGLKPLILRNPDDSANLQAVMPMKAVS